MLKDPRLGGAWALRVKQTNSTLVAFSPDTMSWDRNVCEAGFAVTEWNRSQNFRKRTKVFIRSKSIWKSDRWLPHLLTWLDLIVRNQRAKDSTSSALRRVLPPTEKANSNRAGERENSCVPRNTVWCSVFQTMELIYMILTHEKT